MLNLMRLEVEYLTSLPSINNVFSKVRWEENRINAMIGKKPIDSVESSILVTKQITMKASDHSYKTHEKPRVWCDHCHKHLHTCETCWKLRGKPTNWKSSKQGERNSLHTLNENVCDSNLFSKEIIDQILKLLKTTSSSGNSSVSLAQSSNFLQALSCINSSPWIIDSGASDHMTSFSFLFAFYSPVYYNEKIHIANSNFIPIVGKELLL